MSRGGAALPAVLFVIAMAGALVVGGAFVARSAVGSVRLRQSAGDADAGAERTLMDLIATWDSTARRAQPLGGTAHLAESGVSVKVTRLGPEIFLCLAEFQTSERPRLTRRLAVLVWADATGAAPLVQRGWNLLP